MRGSTQENETNIKFVKNKSVSDKFGKWQLKMSAHSQSLDSASLGENAGNWIILKFKFKQDFAHIIDDKNKIIEAQAGFWCLPSSTLYYI